MPRPPAVPADNIVDAEVCARAGNTIARHYSAAELPRLREAGGHDGSSIEAKFQFSEFDGRAAIAGELRGVAVLTCQRCMQPVPIAIDDEFQVLLVDEERSDEPGGYEPVVANPMRLDLNWLAEEQTLLALPLVPMHDDVNCAAGLVAADVLEMQRNDARPDPEAQTDVQGDGGGRQQPFQNLRDLLRNK